MMSYADIVGVIIAVVSRLGMIGTSKQPCSILPIRMPLPPRTRVKRDVQPSVPLNKE